MSFLVYGDIQKTESCKEWFKQWKVTNHFLILLNLRSQFAESCFKFQDVQDFLTSLESKLQLQASHCSYCVLHNGEVCRTAWNQHSISLIDKAQKWNTGTCIQMLLFSEFVSFNLLFTELGILENFLLVKYGLKLWNHAFLALKVFALLWLVCVVSSCPQSVSITLCEANRSFGCLKDYGLRPWICTVLRHCMT